MSPTARALVALVLAWLLACPSPCWAGQTRLGLFVGNNEGLSGDVPLVFAERDATKMRDLFMSYGSMEGRNATLMLGGTARALHNEFDRLTERARDAANRGDDVFFVFYYSGHGDDDSLHLGTTKLEHVNLRTRIERLGAQVRVAMVDACQSGGLVRRKGGARGPEMAFATPTLQTVQGTAIITSSAASELSQESAQIGGGFFTHYLHTALSGGADRNGDGEVDLSEAYDFVYAETSYDTRDAPVAQTPTREFDLAGAGTVVLTQLEAATANLAFLGDLDGTYAVWDESRKQYVAQVDGSKPVVLAVRPGHFYVHRRMPGWVDEAHYQVRRGETRSVLGEDFVVVTYESTASKGDIDRVIRRAKIPDLALRFVFGARGFGRSETYFAPQAVGGLEARFLSQSRNYWGFDVITGRSTTPLRFDDLPPVPTVMASTTVAGVVGFATGPRLLRAGLGARGGLTGLSRRFPDSEVETQAITALSAGANAWAGIHHGRFTGELQYNWMLMITQFDEQRGWPSYGELLFTLGYRF
ncbi:MAG: caspase family protein [Myxococcales bacterium]|nr:caspase family protein [Myxococcales bacterium]